MEDCFECKYTTSADAIQLLHSEANINSHNSSNSRMRALQSPISGIAAQAVSSRCCSIFLLTVVPMLKL